MEHELAPFLLVGSIASPGLALTGLGFAWLVGWAIPERVVGRVALVATALAAFLAGAGVILGVLGGVFPLVLGPFPWFSVGHYAFELTFRWDFVAIVMVLGTTTLTGLVTAFSVRYLHREPNALRFFVLILAFSAGMSWLVTAASYEQLYLGWEIVGLTSILLIGFFDHRRQPIRAAIRVLVYYRLADLGLLLAVFVLHQRAHTTTFTDVSADPPTGLAGTLVALLVVWAATIKASQLPFGGWLPRAMEGPTPSSALFYGALSVHAGVYLLIRSEPLIAASTVARSVTLGIGLSTALGAALVARVQTDAKTSLAWATLAQVGLMVAEVGIGLPELALAHAFCHASLRCLQLLRAPSLLHDSIALARALGHRTLDGDVRPIPHLAYRALREGLFLEILTERILIQPIIRLGHALEEVERSWAERVARGLSTRPSPAGEPVASPRGSGSAEGSDRPTETSSGPPLGDVGPAR